MKNTIRRMLSLLSSQERVNLLILSGFMIVTALIEVLGIASVAPMLAIITNPQSIEAYPFVQQIYDRFGFEDFRAFSIAMGCMIFAIILVSNLMTLLTTYLSLRYANSREHSIGWNLLKAYLYQPYKFFLTRHSMVLLRNVDNEVAYIISNVLTQGLLLTAKLISSIAILIFIFMINPEVTIVIGLILGVAYGAIYLLIRKQLYTLGVERMALSAAKLKIITDSIRIVKDIKMWNAEEMFLDKFRDFCIRYSRVRTVTDTISIAPRYIVEIFAIGALVFAIIYIVSVQDNPADVLPILGIYAFAGYRLMPALQQIFNALSKIQFSAQSLQLIADEMSDLEIQSEENRNKDIPPVHMNQSFGLEKVSFAYENGASVLKDMSIRIEKGEHIGIIGGSGAGKSTMIDLLVGLNAPSRGDFVVDGNVLTGDALTGWRSNIGYVSQHVYLLDDSVDDNIALERDKATVDHARLARAKTLSLVDEFAGGIDGTVGEDGQRLSGGQRQRVGIARALYRKADILVFDEATSALDVLTERRILENLRGNRDQTMLFITHRVETLKFCDRIYVLSEGRIADSGTYDDLTTRSPFFTQLLHSFKD